MRQVIIALVASPFIFFMSESFAKAKQVTQTTTAPSKSELTTVASPARSWSGMYFGLNGALPYNGITTASGGDSISSIAGYSGGIQAGLDYQSNVTVLGITAEYNISSANNTSENGVKAMERYNYNILLKGGLLIDNDTLIYLKGGYSINNQKLERGTYDPVSDMRGYVIGAGLERFVSDNISLFGEYRYSKYEYTTFTSSSGDVSDLDYKQSEIRIGLNYHF